MESFIEDLFKIYNSSIDSYNSKILQTINNKYTVIDKSMLAIYLYIKILDELKIENDIAKDTLINYLLRQNVYSETGNISLNITDKSRKKLYNEVLEKLIIIKFDYQNRILSHFKYNYVTIPSNQYTSLLSFCERISEYCIIQKLILCGNSEATSYLNNIKINFEHELDIIKNHTTMIDNFPKNIKNNNDIIMQEEANILTNIIENTFENTKYKQLINVALNLKDVYRYSAFTTIVPENVLFHQYTLSIVSILFANYLNNELNESIDIYKLMCKSLFHDFGEYKGNEIISHVKYYNEETTKMFAEMEASDEKDLENKIGTNLYKVIIHYHEEKEGYVSELLDKILGIMKIWIEFRYMNNYTYIKALTSVYQGRFKRFKNIDMLNRFKNPDFLLDLLRETYIYIKENTMSRDRNMFLKYFSEEEEKSFKEELKSIKENKDKFLL